LSKGNAFETDFLKLIWQGVAIANLADNASVSPATDLYVALHTNDPGEGGDQETNELSYAGYARVSVARTTAGWAVSDNRVSNVNAISFGQCTSGTQSAGYVSVGLSATGAGSVLYKGTLTTPLTVSPGVTPRFPAGTLIVTED
jgi:hypothetical protein